MMVLSNASSFNEIRDLVQKGELSGGIIIPSNFSECIISGKQGTIIVITDESNLQLSSSVQAVLTAVFEKMGTALAQQNVLNLNSSVITASNVIAIVTPYTIEAQGVISNNASYLDFMAPGLIAMTVMMSVMTGLPAAISMEKEVGTMDGIMVAPVNRLSIILGKSLSQIIRGLIQGAIILTLAIGIFGVTVHGSILLIILLLLLGVFAFVGLGVVITSFAKDQETATMMMMTLMFPMLFLSGVFFPVQSMPWYMQTLSQFMPLTYASDALRKVMVLGAGIPAITTDLIVLIAFGVAMTIIAVPLFKKLMTR